MTTQTIAFLKALPVRHPTSTILSLAMLFAGCGGGPPPGPGTDAGPVDFGFRDGGLDMGRDGAVSMLDASADAPSDDLGGDVGASQDLGFELDGGVTPSDAGASTDAGSDAGSTTGESPQIVNVAWTVPQDGSCGAGSGIRFSVVVTDDDTNAFFLTPTVTGMGSCFVFGSTSATEMVDITLTNCPHDQAYTPTITLRDPEGHTASVSGFTVLPCANGAYFP